MALPTNVGTGTVVGRFIDSVGLAIVGTVTFTPSPAKLSNTGATPSPVTILPRPVTVTLDAAGSFSRALVATDDVDNNPAGWTYTVSFSFTDAAMAPFSISVPEGTTVDLAVVAPVAAANGTPTAPLIGTDGTPYITQAAMTTYVATHAPSVSGASTTAQGIVELATNTETTTGTDTVRATTPAGVAAAVAVETTRATTAEGTKVSTTTFTAHTGDTTNPHAVTKAQVGLGSVDNTSDATKLRGTFAVVNYGSGAVPLRTTVTTDAARPVWWMGSTPPPTTTGYALAIDVYSSTA